MRRRRWATAIVVAVSALVTAPMAAPGTAAQAQAPTTLRLAITQEIDTLNPFQAVFLSSTQINRLMYEYLTVNSAKDSSPEPGLAESWEASSDNLTWTFRIRKGMQWSDGKPITAKDVQFTYHLIMTNEDAAAANGVAVTNYESVTATDDHTLVIKTKQPQASMLNSEIPIVPEHVWKDVKDIKGFTNTDTFPVVGSGPFVLTGYQEGQSVTLEANDKFWRGRPKVDRMQYVKYENSDAAVQGLKKGDVDMVFRINATQFKALANEPNITTHAGRNRRFTEITMNPSNPKADGTTFGNGNPVLKDLAVRKALAHAVDVKTIIDKVKQGYADPATSIIPPVFGDWAFTPSPQQKHDFDLAKANALLDQAGYLKGPNGLRLDKQGKEITLRVLGNSDRVEDQQTAEYVKGWFTDIGIGLTIEMKSSNQSSDDQNAGNFDLAFTGWSVSPDPDYMLAQQTCKVVGTDLSDSNFCNAEFDQLYQQQQAELDRGKRVALVRKAQSILYDNVAALILTYDKQLEAYRSDRFSGFQTQPADGGIINNQSGYWGYYLATPAGEQSSTDQASSGLGTGAIVGIVGAAAVLVVGLVWGVSRRRRSSADERE